MPYDHPYQEIIYCNTTGVTCRAGITNTFGAPEFILGFLVGFVLLDLQFYV